MEDPLTITDFVAESTTIPNLTEILQQRQEIINTLKHNLQRTKKQMEVQANKKRRDHTFNPGDLVLLLLQPYRQQTVNCRSSKKLSKRVFGLFKVLDRIGSVAYRLDRPSGSKIHLLERFQTFTKISHCFTRSRRR